MRSGRLLPCAQLAFGQRRALVEPEQRVAWLDLESRTAPPAAARPRRRRRRSSSRRGSAAGSRAAPLRRARRIARESRLSSVSRPRSPSRLRCRKLHGPTTFWHDGATTPPARRAAVAADSRVAFPLRVRRVFVSSCGAAGSRCSTSTSGFPRRWRRSSPITLLVTSWRPLGQQRTDLGGLARQEEDTLARARRTGRRAAAACRSGGRGGSACRTRASTPRRGSAAHNCCSTTSGSSDFAMPIRLATRSTCRSTGSPGTPSAWPRTTLAVLRPTPGSSTSASIVLGTLAAVVLRQRRRHADEGTGLRAEEAGGLDLRLELGGRRPRERAGVGISLEQRRRDLVDALVGALRRENRRDEQLVRRREIQLGVGIRDAASTGRRGCDEPPPVSSGASARAGAPRGASPCADCSAPATCTRSTKEPTNSICRRRR